ncbi:TPA: hypothetical protein ACH3X1_006301 [Trebouxia sp. C0004]
MPCCTITAATVSVCATAVCTLCRLFGLVVLYLIIMLNNEKFRVLLKQRRYLLRRMSSGLFTSQFVPKTDRTVTSAREQTLVAISRVCSLAMAHRTVRMVLQLHQQLLSPS